jgi:hypothetical protein
MSYQQDHPPPPPQAPPVIRNRDLLALKAFITAKDENPYEDVHAIWKYDLIYKIRSLRYDNEFIKRRVHHLLCNNYKSNLMA